MRRPGPDRPPGGRRVPVAGSPGRALRPGTRWRWRRWWVGAPPRQEGRTSGLTMLQRPCPRHEAAEVLGDRPGVVGLGVVGGAADVRRQHDLGERGQRVIRRQVLALEVVESRRADLARGQGGHQRVGVVDLGAGRVQEDDAVAHFGEGVGVDHAGRLRRHRGMHGDHVGLGQQLVEGARGVVRVGVVGQDVHAEAAQAPAQGAAHRTEPDQADGAAVQLPGPVALVGNFAVAVDLAFPHVAVGGDDAAGGGEEQGHGELGHGVGVASRGAQDGDPGGGRGRHVDVGGITAAAAHGHDRLLVEVGPADVALDDDDVGALGRRPLGQLGGVVDAERGLVQPRIEHQIRQLVQQIEAGATHGGGHQSLRAGTCHVGANSPCGAGVVHNVGS